MTAGRPWVSPAPRCRCSHEEQLHTRGKRCGVQLDGYPEQELPPWQCPCPGYGPYHGELWRWDTATSSWRGVA